MKTLVRASHKPGPLENGADGCHARFGNEGMCPGVEVAEWLNSLGEDHEPYGNAGKTNGQVRVNWLNSFNHIERRKG
jgi:hypothetical protein